MAVKANFTNKRRRPRPALVVLIVLIHLVVLYGLAKALAPKFTGSIEDEVASVFTVTITTADEDPPAEPEPEGAAGNPGKEAVPQPQAAPEPIVKRDRPMPKASSTGAAVTSGAREEGEGTGASGDGQGTGSGRGGGGQGGGAVVKAVKVSGSINSASDYPIPPGGRSARYGASVNIALLVGTDGVPKRCRVFRPSAFPETDRLTCDLAMARFRFRPAQDRNGNPVESEFGWQQRWCDPSITQC